MYTNRMDSGYPLNPHTCTQYFIRVSPLANMTQHSTECQYMYLHFEESIHAFIQFIIKEKPLRHMCILRSQIHIPAQSIVRGTKFLCLPYGWVLTFQDSETTNQQPISFSYRIYDSKHISDVYGNITTKTIFKSCTSKNQPIII